MATVTTTPTGHPAVDAAAPPRIADFERVELAQALTAAAGTSSWLAAMVKDKARSLLAALDHFDRYHADVVAKLAESTSTIRRYVWAMHLGRGVIETYAPLLPMDVQGRLHEDVARLYAMEPATDLGVGLAFITMERDVAVARVAELLGLIRAMATGAVDIPVRHENGALGPVPPEMAGALAAAGDTQPALPVPAPLEGTAAG